MQRSAYRRHRFFVAGLAVGFSAMWGCMQMQPVRVETPSRWALEKTELDRSAARLGNTTAEHLAWAKALRSRTDEVQGPRTIRNTLVPYNEMMMHLDAAVNEAGLLARVHPDKEVREVAEECERKVKDFLTQLELDRGLYEAFLAVDVNGTDASTRYFVEKKLRDFRRAGVDQSDEERERIARLRSEIVRLGQTFLRNISEDEKRRAIVLDSPADLAGLPQDWIDNHPPGPDGRIRVTTRYPDFIPFLQYAHNAEARKRLYIESKNRGYPDNLRVLDQLLARRHELANVLGYEDWADYITEDKMIRSAEAADSFLQRVAEISGPVADSEYTRLLERKAQMVPGATEVTDWEKNYFEQLVRSEQFRLDPAEVRAYFNFPDVLQGLFLLTQQMFGVQYRQVHGLNLWHQDVTAWDVFEGDKPVGRFYLDLHPRSDKYGHAAQFDYHTGIRGKRLPQAVLVCNFANPHSNPDGNALMEHQEVVTFFHEFGHLLHALFAGHRDWIGNAGISTEWDFVEAPSQILEEWCFDTEALRLFARHYVTREPIPDELVANLRRANEFGKGLYARHQTFYAAMSLEYYNRDPSEIDTTELMKELQERYSPFDYVPDTHMQCSFGHLDGYSAMYYTYMWSKVISKDLFSRFQDEGLLNPKAALHYRRTILEPGGSKPAAQLVADFLGRPFSFDAFERWISS